MMFKNWGLPSPQTNYFFSLSWFHDYINSYLLGIMVFVSMYFLYLIFTKGYFKYEGEAMMKMESLMAFYPVLILLLQIIPSLFLVYSNTMMENMPELTVKITGHQWYWSYELSDMDNLNFDSFMKMTIDLFYGDSRLLSVDNVLVIPVNIYTRFCVTSSDVIHSWTLAGVGLKLDAIPGVLNTTNVKLLPVGIYYGQCSEICGSNHSFMSVCLEVTTWDTFINYVKLLMKTNM